MQPASSHPAAAIGWHHTLKPCLHALLACSFPCREFVEHILPQFRQDHPQLLIEAVVQRGKHPGLHAEYCERRCCLLCKVATGATSAAAANAQLAAAAAAAAGPLLLLVLPLPLLLGPPLLVPPLLVPPLLVPPPLVPPLLPALQPVLPFLTLLLQHVLLPCDAVSFLVLA